MGLVLHHLSGYAFGTEEDFPVERLKDLRNLLLLPEEQTARTRLGGRSPIIRGEVPGLGVVVVKRYTRGGIIGRLIKHRYLKLGDTRGQREFSIMKKASELGVNTAKPLAFAYSGWPLYSAWLFTEELKGVRTLAEISRCDENIADYIHSAAQQIASLIHSGIFHVDLHPGNILVDEAGKVYLFDFDKATYFKGNQRQLRDNYITRWRRAVIKHGLPDSLSEHLCGELRRSYE